MLIVTLSAALALGCFTNGHDWGDDFAGYISQASSLIHHTVGESVARTAFTMQQSSWPYAPIAYPWGFPVLLAPAYMACGGLNIFCLKLLNIPLFVLFLVVFSLLVARRLPLVDAALILSVMAFNPVLLQFLNNVLSDIAFLFASTWAVLLIDRYIVDPARAEGSPAGNVRLGVVIFFACFLRVNGLVLVPTLALTQAIVWRRHVGPSRADWRRALRIAAIPYEVFGALAIAARLLFPAGEAAYIAHFRGMSVKSMLSNLSTYAVTPVEFFAPIPAAGIAYGAIVAFALVGVVRRHREDVHLLVYAGLMALLLIVWPDQEGLRYLYPLLPFLVYFGYRGMQTVAFTVAGRHRRSGVSLTRAVWAFVAALFLIVSFDKARANVAIDRAPEDGPFRPASTELFEWIKARTPPDSAVAFFKPRVMTLMTGRRALLIDTCDQLGKAEYVVIQKQADPSFQVDPSDAATCSDSVDMTRAFANETSVVYRVTPKP